MNPTFTPAVDGTYVLSLVVNDGTADSTADTVTITVFDPAAASVQIYGAIAAAYGPVSIDVPFALVTYVREAIGYDSAGFFIQAEQTGPALCIAVDASTLSPVPVAGQMASLSITDMGTDAGGIRQADAISGYTVISEGNNLRWLLQDVSATTDLVTAITEYECEFIEIEATIDGDFAPAGTGFVSAAITTAGIPVADPGLVLRIPETLQNTLLLEPGCSVTISGTPIWKYNATTEVSAWTVGDISANSCPQPAVVSAYADGSNSVVVTFSTNIDPASIDPGGSQFAFNGLTASAASASANTVTVTTDSQTSCTEYTVTVDNTVTDLHGNAIDALADSTPFSGFSDTPGVGLVINEVDYDNAGTDYNEFVEIFNPTGGGVSLSGIPLILFNGATGISYNNIDLTGQGCLAAGEYLVVASSTVTVDPGATVITFSYASNNIQNGPDALALVNEETDTIIDSLSYEGDFVAQVTQSLAVSLVEGTELQVFDDNAVDGSLARIPNGGDTDDNDNDWAFTPTVTPGAVNQ